MKASRLTIIFIMAFISVVACIIILLSSCLEVHGSTTVDENEYLLVAGAERIMNVIENEESIVIELKKERLQKSYSFSKEEEIILQKIALAEARGDGIGAMAKVMQVVMNRVESKKFPDSIEGVIFQSSPSVQFATTVDGSYSKMIPNENSKKALELLKVLEPIDALYFEADTKEETWHSNNLEFCFQYKNHNFYK